MSLDAGTHQVRVDAFSISQTAVTNEQFAAFVASTPPLESSTSRTTGGKGTCRVAKESAPGAVTALGYAPVSELATTWDPSGASSDTGHSPVTSTSSFTRMSTFAMAPESW